jgi:hypothetical protein
MRMFPAINESFFLSPDSPLTVVVVVVDQQQTMLARMTETHSMERVYIFGLRIDGVRKELRMY